LSWWTLRVVVVLASTAPLSAESSCGICTVVSLIPEGRDSIRTGGITDRVATLSDLRGLANVLAMLVPRTQVARELSALF
jgi:hypothetical protein